MIRVLDCQTSVGEVGWLESGFWRTRFRVGTKGCFLNHSGTDSNALCSGGLFSRILIQVHRSVLDGLPTATHSGASVSRAQWRMECRMSWGSR